MEDSLPSCQYISENLIDPLLTKTCTKLVWVGEKKYCLPGIWMEQGEGFFNFKTRPDDTWVVSFARSGTTVTQEMIWLLQNDLDYTNAKKFYLNDRFPEISASLIPDLWKETKVACRDPNDPKSLKLMKCDFNKASHEVFSELPSPRFFKSHIPLSLLRNILDSKVVYIARNPKDKIVSAYRFCISNDIPMYGGGIVEFWRDLKNNLVPWHPYWEHVKEAWTLRNHSNLLFIFFEELRSDLRGTIKKVAEFLGKSYTNEEVEGLADHLDIDNFRNNPMVNKLKGFKKVSSFIGKGSVGGWKELITPDLEVEIDEWIAENLKDCDFIFPKLPKD